MGYRKVYLTIEEEEDILRIKEWREREERGGSAFNAILKEGLGLVMSAELALHRPQVPSPQATPTPRVRRRPRG